MCSLRIPHKSCFFVRRDSAAVMKRYCKVVHGHYMALLCCLGIPFDASWPVLRRSTKSVCDNPTQVVLSCRITSFSAFRIPWGESLLACISIGLEPNDERNPFSTQHLDPMHHIKAMKHSVTSLQLNEFPVIAVKSWLGIKATTVVSSCCQRYDHCNIRITVIVPWMLSPFTLKVAPDNCRTSNTHTTIEALTHVRQSYILNGFAQRLHTSQRTQQDTIAE
mmetsp:Transcript_106505/g.211591  ORF Transcript_106505/g.211591 Transcript_106505/m.211591 type:complete len:221 (+) Transcript_106505:475-1137(+)